MTTRLTFGMLVAGVILVTGFSVSDAAAQPRPVANVRNQRPAPSIQNFPQVQHPSIQMTINNAYMSEWSRRMANTPILIQPPIYVIQPYAYYYPYGYMNGNNRYMGDRYWR